MKEISYKTAKELTEAYFDSRKKKIRDKKGEYLTDENGEYEYDEKPSTVTGLALALGFSRREELFEIKDEKTKALISRALLMIEEKAEEKLFDKESFNGTKLFLMTNFPRWQENAAPETEDDTDLGVFSAWAK